MNRPLSLLIGFLAISAIYLYAFPQANVFYRCCDCHKFSFTFELTS